METKAVVVIVAAVWAWFNWPRKKLMGGYQERWILRKVANILSYLQRRRRKKLYQQWVEKAGLLPEAVPLKVQNSRELRLPLLYVFLGASALILCLGIILLIIHSC